LIISAGLNRSDQKFELQQKKIKGGWTFPNILLFKLFTMIILHQQAIEHLMQSLNQKKLIQHSERNISVQIILKYKL
jgi:hypothetical protein